MLLCLVSCGAFGVGLQDVIVIMIVELESVKLALVSGVRFWECGEVVL